MNEPAWSLLIYELPRPLYPRVKIRRRLAALGAVSLQKSIYALSAGEASTRTLLAIVDEARRAGGQAYVCEAHFSDDRADALLRRRFLGGVDKAEKAASSLLNRTWVTRRGIQIDRIASAWLIRRFIDPRARFRFVDVKADTIGPNELRFDMAGGDFTHEEDRCSFEAFVRRLGLADRALSSIAEIVHDIDIKDGKFGRAEAAGIEQLLVGTLLANPGDEERLERGFRLFDDLYQSFGRRDPNVNPKKVAEKGGRP